MCDQAYEYECIRVHTIIYYLWVKHIICVQKMSTLIYYVPLLFQFSIFLQTNKISKTLGIFQGKHLLEAVREKKECTPT